MLAEIKAFLLFGFVGLTTAGVNIGTLAVLLETFNIEYRISSSVSYIIGVLFHFSMNKLITFNKRSMSGTGQQALKYLVLVLVNYMITLLLVVCSVETFHLTPYYGVAFSMGVTMITGYTISRFWIFKKVSN